MRVTGKNTERGSGDPVRATQRTRADQTEKETEQEKFQGLFSQSIINENSVCYYTGEQTPQLQGNRCAEICAFAASEMLNVLKAIDTPLYISLC